MAWGGVAAGGSKERERALPAVHQIECARPRTSRSAGVLVRHTDSPLTPPLCSYDERCHLPRTTAGPRFVSGSSQAAATAGGGGVAGANGAANGHANGHVNGGAQ